MKELFIKNVKRVPGYPDRIVHNCAAFFAILTHALMKP